LILGEDVLTYQNGKVIYKKSASDSFSIDFGPEIGQREVARLNLIECESCFQSLREEFEGFKAIYYCIIFLEYFT
jgi:hypothetical protein